MPVYLTDFGLAKATATGSKYTRSGQALGTPAYMSPEQARGEVAALAPATDVWSLGCVLHELLAGAPPFEGETAAVVILGVLTREPVRLRTIRADVPEPVERVIRVCLSKFAGDRYVTARELGEDLDRILRGERPRARPRRRLAPVLAAVLSVAAVAGVAWIVVGHGRPSARDAAADPAELAAIAAWELRHVDPIRARDAMRAASGRLPARDGLRVQLGLLEWAGGDLEAARAAWRAVSPAAPEATRARWLEGLAAEARAVATGDSNAYADARQAWTAAARGADPEARWARAGLAVLDGEDARARNLLAGAASWEADLLAGLCEASALAGGRPARLDDGLRAFDRALARGLPFAWAYDQRGALRRNLGDPVGALADHERAAALDPRAHGASYNAGLARAALGDGPGAAAAYTRALDLAPDFAPAYVARGLVRAVAGDHAAAIADYDAALALVPDDVVARINRGNARAALGDLAAGLADLDAALTRAPRHPGGLLNRGRLRSQHGDLRGALADYEAAVAADPRSATAWVRVGQLRADLGDLAGAQAALEEAIRLEPDAAPTLAARAVLREKTGDLAGALADLDAALAAAPDDRTIRTNRGAFRASAGNLAGALEDLDRVLAADPHDRTARVNRAQVHQMRGALAEAVADYDVAIAAEPGDPQLRCNRGVARAILRDVAGARADFDAAIAIAPTNPDGFTNRGRLRHSQGDAGAEEDLLRALAMAPADWSGRAATEALVARIRATRRAAGG